MKRFYLFNVFFALILFILLAFFKQNGFFMANIMRQDIIFYVAVMSVFTIIAIAGIGYQIHAINWKDKKALIYQIPALLTTLYIISTLGCLNQIYITAGTGLIILLISIPAALILFTMTMSILDKRKATA